MTVAQAARKARSFVEDKPWTMTYLIVVATLTFIAVVVDLVNGHG